MSFESQPPYIDLERVSKIHGKEVIGDAEDLVKYIYTQTCRLDESYSIQGHFKWTQPQLIYFRTCFAQHYIRKTNEELGDERIKNAAMLIFKISTENQIGNYTENTTEIKQLRLIENTAHLLSTAFTQHENKTRDEKKLIMRWAIDTSVRENSRRLSEGLL